MRVLALDTTTRAGSVAVVDDARVLVDQSGDPSRSHAQRLPGDLLTALDRAGLGLREIDLFAVASGPGSFTGLRIGIATMQGLAFVSHKRIVPVSALVALAHAASPDLTEGASVGAWMDAYRRDVFSALYRVGKGRPFSVARLTEIEPPTVGDPASTWARWTAGQQIPAVMIGDGAEMYATIIAGRSDVRLSPSLASIIGRLAVAHGRLAQTVDPADVQPLYVRRPDAEIARESLHHKGQGERSRS
jgi:tRNA threonylcarbamoyladenosine biosynthesis protein TsaB